MDTKIEIVKKAPKYSSPATMIKTSLAQSLPAIGTPINGSNRQPTPMAMTSDTDRVRKDPKGRMKLHADIAHPINAQCRQSIQKKVTEAFEQEFEKSKEPGYEPIDLDEADDEVPEIV